MGWDESADKFLMGTTTATGASTGNLSVTTGTLVANLEGNITGNATSVTNGVYTTSSVTALSDVSNVGSGSIITSSERTKLAGIATSANNYSLPTASASTKGGFKVGSGLSMSGETLSAPSSSVFVTSGSDGVKYTSGNVGIGGAASANARLYLEDDSHEVLRIYKKGAESYGSETDGPSNSSHSNYQPKGTVVSISSVKDGTAQTNATFINMNAYNSSNGNSAVYLGNVAGNSNGAGNFVIGRRTGSTSFAESMRIDKTGKVGIGTRSPGEKLEIGENSTTHDNTDKIICISQQKTYKYNFGITKWNKYSSGSGKYDLEIGYKHIDSTNNQNYGNIILTPYLNVGIGTTSPSYKLDVAGTGRFTGALTANLTGNVTGNLTGSVETPSQTNITGVGTITTGTWNATAIADGYISSAATWNAKQSALSTTNRLDASFIGNNSNVSSTEYGYLNGVTGGIQTQLNGKQATISSTTDVTCKSLTIPDYIIHDGDTSCKFGFSGTDNFMIRTGGSSRVLVDASGNVGIGTTSPYCLLQIGNLGAGSNVYSETKRNRLAFPSHSHSNNRYLFANRDPDNDTACLDLHYVHNTSSLNKELMTFTSDGNIGIGDTTPSYKLDVAGDINLTGDISISGTDLGLEHLTNASVSGTEITLGISTTTAILPSPNGTVDLGSSSKKFDVLYASKLNNGVSFTLPTGHGSSGQVLTNNGSGTLSWTTASGGASALNDLTDVSTSGAQNNYALVYNGSSWAPAAQS